MKELGLPCQDEEVSLQTGTDRISGLLQQPQDQGKAKGLAACNSQTASPFGCLNNFYCKILSNFWGSLHLRVRLFFARWSHRVRGSEAANKIQSVFLRRRVRRKKHPALASAQRNWPRQTRRLMSGQSVFLRAMRAKMRGSEREPFFKKGVPFLKSSKRE